MTGLLAYGETMGAVHQLELGPLRIGSTMRTSIAGAEATVASGVSRY